MIFNLQQILLQLNLEASIVVPDRWTYFWKLQQVTSTAAELNLLDGVWISQQTLTSLIQQN